VLLGATVIDRFALRRDVNAKSERIRLPHTLWDQIVLVAHSATVAHRIDKKVEHLRFEGPRLGPAAQLGSLDIEQVIPNLRTIAAPSVWPRWALLNEKTSSP
jgi:hypothetical protein